MTDPSALAVATAASSTCSRTSSNDINNMKCKNNQSLAESSNTHQPQHSSLKRNPPSSNEDVGRAKNETIDLCTSDGDDQLDDHTSLVLPRKQPRGGKRKRSAEDLNEFLSEFKSSPHYLRIPASSVSALCGLHPFQNLPQLLFDFVYQSYLGQLLLQQDARALGLTLVDAKTHEQETMLNLASAASKETKELVKQVLEVSEGKRKLQSVEEVQSIQKKIKEQTAKAQKSGRLSKKQVESLVEASRGHVSTGFGTCHEDEALDVYEKRIGCSVRERNEALMEWRFERVCDVNSELGVTAVPMGQAKRRGWEQLKKQASDDDRNEEPAAAEAKTCGTPEEPIDIDGDINAADLDDSSKVKDSVGVNQNEANDGNDTSISVRGDKPKPFFRIVGAVDGIRDELYLDSSKPACAAASKSDVLNDANKLQNNDVNAHDEFNFSDDEEDQWSLRPIIVECKHRMNEAKVPPPLYDQIQTCLYCHMYNVEEADLVQVVRRKSRGDKKENIALNNNEGIEKTDGIRMKNTSNSMGDGNRESKAKNTTNLKDSMNITITRVSLNDPIHNHNHHWKATLLPRLASFVEAVYNVRKDDGKRYRLLMALVQSQQEDSNSTAEEEAWKVLWEECPWIQHCDTAFGKRRRF